MSNKHQPPRSTRAHGASVLADNPCELVFTERWVAHILGKNPVTDTNHPSNAPSKRIAILATDGFEQVELPGSRDALHSAGHKAHILSVELGQVQGFHHDKHGDKFDVEGTFAEAKAADYDAVLLPCGVMIGDAMRTNEEAQALVEPANDAGKPIAVI